MAATPPEDKKQVPRRLRYLIELAQAQLQAGHTAGIRELFAEAAKLGVPVKAPAAKACPQQERILGLCK